MSAIHSILKLVDTLIFQQRPVSWVADHLRRAPGVPAVPAAGGSGEGEGGAGAGPQHPHTRPRLPRCDPPCPNTPYDTIITTSHANTCKHFRIPIPANLESSLIIRHFRHSSPHLDRRKRRRDFQIRAKS